MQVRSLIVRILVFAGALTLGLTAAVLFFSKKPEVVSPGVVVYSRDTNATSSCQATGPVYPPAEKIDGPCVNTGNCELKIESQPSPAYTEEARQNNVQGTVRLRVTFLADGKIGGIAPLSRLNDGLTEQAVAAARNIKFRPATKNKKPVTTSKVVEYSFTITN